MSEPGGKNHAGDLDAGAGENGPGRLSSLLALEAVGGDRFMAPATNTPTGRLFGGQVASQSLKAAHLTVGPDRRVHSLHAYFVLGGKPGVPVDFTVRRTRDGRSFTTRHVTASQDGAAIFEMIASFHVDEPGDDWQAPGPVLEPGPEQLEPIMFPGFMSTLSVFDIRPLAMPDPNRFPIFKLHPYWIRAVEPIGDDPVQQACVLAFLSDIAAMAAARAPHSSAGMASSASLDHALWFHRPPRADEWLLYNVGPVSNHGARGLAVGTFHARNGTLVASMAQEALLRPDR